jgi:2-oxoglutarate dehydrogenase E1 component
MKRGVSSSVTKSTFMKPLPPKQTFGHLRAASMSFKTRSGLNKPMGTAASSTQYYD